VKLLLSLLLAGSLATPAVAAQAVPQPAAAPPISMISLVPHRAIYEVSLGRTRPGGMVAASGRTVIEFSDSCTGWTTTQRFVADMTNGQDDPTRTDFMATSWESKDGYAMRFSVHNSIDGKTQEKFQGKATLAASGLGSVDLEVPHGKHFGLPAGAILPTGQTLQVLRAVANGGSAVHELVFQGGDKKDLYEATALIGRAATPGELAEDRAIDHDHLLDHQSARSVLISYFPYNSAGTTPDYEIAYRLYPNGVISSMSLIYSNFTLHAKLSKLERLSPHC
jgi:hypothetical protein